MLILLLLACTSCGPKTNRQSPVVASDPPVLCISQTGEVPGPGQSRRMADGFFAVLWTDGRMFRCVTRNTVGQTYEKGIVPAAARADFFVFLENSAVVKSPPGQLVLVHSATRYVTCFLNGTNMIWSAPWDDHSPWFEVEQRLLNLPLKNSRTIKSSEVGSLQTGPLWRE